MFDVIIKKKIMVKCTSCFLEIRLIYILCAWRPTLCLLILHCKNMLQEKNRCLRGFWERSSQKVRNGGYREHQRYNSMACETTLLMAKNITDWQLENGVLLMHWVETPHG